MISISLIVFTAVVCHFLVDFVGYQVVAFILLLVVSAVAMLFDIYPVLVTATLSALIWNFFFIPPTFTFHIGTPQDDLMFLMYFVIALINAALTFKIREFERKKRTEEEKTKTIKLYSTLLNSLSHELRTPISTVIGAIDTIKDREANLSVANRKKLYDEIEIAGFRLNRQVENLLNMNRLEAGILKPNLDWIDINELVFTVIKENRSNALHHKIIFEPNDNAPLMKADGGFLELILNNLIHNALQHTPVNSSIHIDLQFTVDLLLIEVSDNGSGFPQETIDRVFDKFYKLNQRSAKGTGLGLSIVKGFTEAMNGKIFLENKTSGGAKFRIEIPVETSSKNDLNHE